MRVQLHNGFTQVQSLEATRVVIFDDFDNPIALVAEHTNSPPGEKCKGYIYGTVEHGREFNALLRAMGVDRTVIVQDFESQPMNRELWVP